MKIELTEEEIITLKSIMSEQIVILLNEINGLHEEDFENEKEFGDALEKRNDMITRRRNIFDSVNKRQMDRKEN